MAGYRVYFADTTVLLDDESYDEEAFEEIVASRFHLPPSQIEVARLHGDWFEFMVWFSFQADSPEALAKRGREDS